MNTNGYWGKTSGEKSELLVLAVENIIIQTAFQKITLLYSDCIALLHAEINGTSIHKIVYPHQADNEIRKVLRDADLKSLLGFICNTFPAVIKNFNILYEKISGPECKGELFRIDASMILPGLKRIIRNYKKDEQLFLNTWKGGYESLQESLIDSLNEIHNVIRGRAADFCCRIVNTMLDLLSPQDMYAIPLSVISGIGYENLRKLSTAKIYAIGKIVAHPGIPMERFCDEALVMVIMSAESNSLLRAYDILFQRHILSIVKFVRCKVNNDSGLRKNEEFFHDVATTSFTKAFTYLHHYDIQKARFTTYLFNIARNVFLTKVKSVQKHEKVFREEIDWEKQQSHQPNEYINVFADEYYEKKTGRDELSDEEKVSKSFPEISLIKRNAIVSVFKGDDLDVLILRIVKDCSWLQIKEILQDKRQITAMRKQYSRNMRMLKNELHSPPEA
jgi:DNA-directed RNA polymerase specialized sigma24 family protein